ncbi:unnamed protein product [Sphenostylis stenocarpa]|uniref:RRM domain-containing protein n=1 Tax=Sphenostylis stenocarpa TaxID=92480 RepID=A0AA86T0F0_9FABA|nr:unnamed protein product [Sphenostylis stenocarpa]
MLPEHINGGNLRIVYSGYRDLNIKFQSNRSRDYTNAALPVNQATIGRAVQPMPPPADNHVLLASFENMLHYLTLDVVHGNTRSHALIQYHDVATATAAKEALEGHCIYDGGYCKIHVSYSHHTDINVKPYSEKSRDYARPEHSVSVPQVPGTAWQNPHAVSMNPSSGVPAYAYGYPATFPDQVYGYALGQSNPIVHTEGYIEFTPHGVPAFSPPMQAGFLGFLPACVQPYYYGY